VTDAPCARAPLAPHAALGYIGTVVDDRIGPFGAVLVFDGECGFCTTAASWAARRFRHGERVQAWQLAGEEFLERHGLTVDDVRSAAWWVSAAGTERGHRAIGRALEAGGGLRRLIGWCALHPPTSALAAGIYRLVVRWRYRLPGGTPACRVGDRTS
jgi:predicted DCC family thiol-disulfide oxidoreductase YuxK